MLGVAMLAWKMGYAAFGRAAAKKWQAEATILAERTQSRTVSRSLYSSCDKKKSSLTSYLEK